MTIKKIDIFNGGLAILEKELEAKHQVLKDANQGLSGKIAEEFVKQVQIEANAISTPHEQMIVSNKSLNEITTLGNTTTVTHLDLQATYSEYGTGIIGSQNPHPDPRLPWVYDINEHGEKGWVYPFPDGTGFAHTRGLPSVPVYSISAQKIRQRLPSIIEEHIKKLMERTDAK